MFTHKLESAVFAQGWVGGQIESAVANLAASEIEQEQAMGAQLEEMWAVVDTTMDELIQENRDLRVKLQLAQDALR
jgi:hypothetical protein